MRGFAGGSSIVQLENLNCRRRELIGHHKVADFVSEERITLDTTKQNEQES